MKVVITGATGFVGAHLVRYFSAKGYEIIALGRSLKPPKNLLKLASYRSFDFEDEISTEKIEADICIHAAALTDTRCSFNKMMAINVRGTEKLLSMVNCKQFIFISSSSVYQSGFDRTESMANANDTAHLSHYGKSKLLTEQLLTNNFEKGLTSFQSLVIFRPRAIYGKGDRLLLPKLLRLVKNKLLFWPGKKFVPSTMTHIDNICYACALSIDKIKTDCHVFNLGDLKVYNLFEVVKSLNENIKRKKLKSVLLPAGFLLPVLKFIYGNNSRYFELMQLNAPLTLDLSSIKYFLDYNSERAFSESEIGDWYHEAKVENTNPLHWPWISV
jgi:nucleoside-diphosphate-sugar epimerase